MPNQTPGRPRQQEPEPFVPVVIGIDHSSLEHLLNALEAVTHYAKEAQAHREGLGLPGTVTIGLERDFNSRKAGREFLERKGIRPEAIRLFEKIAPELPFFRTIEEHARDLGLKVVHLEGQARQNLANGQALGMARIIEEALAEAELRGRPLGAREAEETVRSRMAQPSTLETYVLPALTPATHRIMINSALKQRPDIIAVGNWHGHAFEETGRFRIRWIPKRPDFERWVPREQERLQGIDQDRKQHRQARQQAIRQRKG